MATELTLRDGTPAFVWPVLPTDREGLAVAYRHLDAESRYHRFLSSVPQLSEAMLDQLVDGVDGVDHVALVMVVFDDDWQSTPAGVARMIRYPDDPVTADVAVTVTPEVRGRGVATALLSELLVHRPKGVTRIFTEVAADNTASIRMLQRLGPTTLRSTGPGTYEATVELPPPAQDQ
jgi:RimJ/RimL family protein N-acetyltransferase